MNPKLVLHFIVLIGSLTSGALAAEIRVFHSADGKSLKASFEGMSGEMIILKREDGKIFSLGKDKLSAADQLYVSQFAQRAGELTKKLNTAAGQELTNGVRLSERKAEELAKTLGVRLESESKYGRSWRLYAARAKDYLMFCAMPYSVAIYSNEAGYVTHLSLVYANKGDFGSTAGMGEDHFKGGTTATAKSLAEAMDRDEATVAKALTAVLGAATIQRFGEGKTRRKVSRWDWNGHSFILSNEENEYVSLAIMPSEVADAGGKSAMTKDAEIKKRLLASVVKSDNGDVYLSEIPMVDQGPKGYCAPATFERAMRTMGLEADMYLLAMVGESQAGGGTSIQTLMEGVRRQVFSKGRRIKEENLKELRIRDFKRYIDEGIPIMWTMCSLEKYNEIADENTETRSKVADWKAHATKITTDYAKYADRTKEETNHHVCMIIGYNEATQEVAVSDSWGARCALRWVPVSVSNWVSNGGIFMILP
jgi:Peptidase_C39 like family